jgi:nitrous oxidase accessory protein
VWTLSGRGNYWSDYSGYDANGDGVGDNAYEPRPPFAGGLTNNPTLGFFRFTIAQEAIDAAARMFPVYDYDPVIRDESPLMQAPGPALAREQSLNRGLLAVSALLVLLAGTFLVAFLDIDLLAALPRLVTARRAS